MSEFQFSLSDRDVDKIADAILQRTESKIKPSGNGTAPLFFNERDPAKMLGVSVYLLKRLRQQGAIKVARGSRPVGYTSADVTAAGEYLKTRGASR